MTRRYFRDSPFPHMRDGASRGIGFEIGQELTRKGVALGINTVVLTTGCSSTGTGFDARLIMDRASEPLPRHGFIVLDSRS